MSPLNKLLSSHVPPGSPGLPSQYILGWPIMGRELNKPPPLQPHQTPPLSKWKTQSPQHPLSAAPKMFQHVHICQKLFRGKKEKVFLPFIQPIFPFSYTTTTNSTTHTSTFSSVPVPLLSGPHILLRLHLTSCPLLYSKVSIVPSSSKYPDSLYR